MNLPPRNYLDNAPNSPSAHQVETAAHQQGVKEDLNASTRGSQVSAEMINQMRTSQAAESTEQAAANTQLDYYKAAMQQNAGLTQGAEHMASLAQKYAPQGGSIEDIAHAIRQGIGV